MTARSYPGHGAVVGRTIAESSPWWNTGPRAPEGAPNIVVVLLDDMGFSDIGPFGSEIDTPHLVAFRSFEVETRLVYAEGDAGVLFAHGDQGGGYHLRIEDGGLHFAFNEYGLLKELDGGPLDPGPHLVSLRATAVPDYRWSFDLLVDGVSRGGLPEVLLLFGMAPAQGVDVGADRRNPVSWPVYERHRAFPYSGALDSVTYLPGEPAPYDPQRVLALLAEAQVGRPEPPTSDAEAGGAGPPDPAPPSGYRKRDGPGSAGAAPHTGSKGGAASCGGEVLSRHSRFRGMHSPTRRRPPFAFRARGKAVPGRSGGRPGAREQPSVFGPRGDCEGPGRCRRGATGAGRPRCPPARWRPVLRADSPSGQILRVWDALLRVMFMIRKSVLIV